MSGHSKWHSIKHKKAAADAKRGKMFTKIIKEISISARIGGGDPEANPRLRKAVLDARGVNMPADNIKRAIMKGTGQLGGSSYEDVIYEGYGPGGAALYIEATTDNKNRTVSELRHIFAKNGGNIGESGCVGWMFKRKGYVIVEKEKGGDEDKLLDVVMNASAEDMREDGSNWEIISAPEHYDSVVDALKSHGIETASSSVAYLPQTYVKLEGKQAQQMLRLMDELEDHEDVQHVWANFDVEETELEGLSA